MQAGSRPTWRGIMGSLLTGPGAPRLARVFTLLSTVVCVDLCSVTVGVLVVALTCLSLSI